MERTICHIDMDAFFAAVEQLRNPALKGKPVIVGGGLRGVVSTASYEARAFGIHSAMPIFQARRLCPQGVFLPARMGLYREVSARIMDFLTRVSPKVEQVSVDEAYLDLTGTRRLLGEPVAVAGKIKNWILQNIGLTCSVGIAPNKFLAKIASDWDKPDGLTVIEEDRVDGFLRELPVAKLPGVGQKTLEILLGLGISRVGQIQKLPEAILIRKFGKFGGRLLELSRGVDSSEVTPCRPPKSISSEDTLDQDTDDVEILSNFVMAQAATVGKRLRRQGLRARTVTLKLKYSDFRLTTRAHTLEGPTDSTKTIRDAALKLLRSQKGMSKVRLVGVSVSGFDRGAEQLSLFGGSTVQDEKQARLDRAVDEVTEKFGEDLLRKGS
ncbi:MAG: DNA polymerase IV [Deltaproteobacteria bacterium]|nr:DNA polymerase IV [Deltaproteobacteria bacterium]MBW2120654.1 DNA polymerase IV [Deltaproteobacteria bacterium]